MTLFEMHDNTMNGMEIPCESHRVEEHTDCQGSHVRWVCPRNSSLRTADIYIFKPDRELQAELNVTLFQTEEASPLPFSGDDGQPKNLRCHFNGVDRLLCSWEVRQEVTSSVLFTLFYKVTQTSEEKECLQVYEEKVSDIPYVQQHCEIYVTNCNHTSQYHVTVRPKKEKKHIDASKHIKVLAPTNLTVTTKEDQEYELRWVKHKLQYGFIKQSYQVLYWKADQSSEAAKSINISNDEPPFIFPSQMLESSTCYRAKMRARVHASSDYDGPWSEWSEECAWQTGHVVSPLILPFMVSVVTIILIATGWCSCKYLFNKKKKWEEKIPNPSKSQLVQGFFQKGPLGNLMPSKLVVFDNQSHLEKVEQINNIQVLHSMVKVISARMLQLPAGATMMNFYSVFLLLLPWAFGVRKLRESIPQQSLTCYNDYTSLMTCMWEECSEAQHFLNMTLYYNDDTEDSIVIPCESHQVEGRTDCQGSHTHWVCRKNHTTFGIERKVIYSLKPNQELQTELRVILFQNVQPLPPQNLFINVTEGGDFLLAWEAAGGINGSTWPDSTLEYEVTYKRDWESWESSSSVLVSNTSKYLFRHNSLVPGSTYVARVRAKPSQESNFTGQYSAWSTKVSWKTQAGDDGHPKNLRCLFNGVDRLLCSWEVRQEVTSSVLFTLFYKVTQTSEEKECLPIHEKKLPNIPYVSQSCEISITNPNHMFQYNISVRPQKVEMHIEPFKHIRVPAPVNLTVTKTNDQEYELRWVKHALHYKSARQTYEVWYWKADQPLEIAKPTSISIDEPPLVLHQGSLDPLTCYRAKVRARVRASSAYNGTWSEWSEEYTWKTEHVLAPYVLIVIAIFFTIMLVAVGWYSCKYLLSKKKKWEEKIPNPSKSHLLQGFLQVSLRNQLPSSLPDFNRENHLVKEQANSLQVLDGEKIISNSPGAEASKTKLSYIVLDLKNQHQFSPVSSPASLPSSPFDSISNQNTSQSSSPTLLTSVGATKADTASQKPMTSFSYNGPYLFFPSGQSQTNTHQDLGASPVRIREKPVFLEYVSLPQKGCFQFPLLQKTGSTHLYPFACLDQKEKKHPVAGGQDALQDQPAGEEGVKEKREGQRSPIAVPVISSSQKCPLEYFTTEGLCLVPAKESVNLSPSLDPQEQMLTTAGTLTSNSQLPQATDDPSSPALPSGRSVVSLPVPAQASATPPGSQQPELGSNMTLALPQGLPEHISLSHSASLEEVAQENDLVTFNPNGGRPVFLYQVGEYCFFPGLKPSEKTPLSQKASLASKLSEDSGAVGKPA
ncbi:cytokine receptor common subunit beta-like [Alligator mississippiensis]|uniref:Cytokine receptor common subunit beta-like n=1 Tax=Alligator mississippiensis TaxID=8496 RepID=A0A151NHT7_ALLMI|nr:cytokine receptor common subunit beta-like [Alligator mississippiensis]